MEEKKDESQKDVTRTFVKSRSNSAWFETVSIKKKPCDIEMLRTILTRNQSDCGLNLVFSESTKIDYPLTQGDYPIDSFNFYWAIQYCNALSISCYLEPCYSIAGETNPKRWLGSPYRQFMSYNKKWYEDLENSDYYAGVVFNPKANGWRLPTKEECILAAENDLVKKESVPEIKWLWVWGDANEKGERLLVSSSWESKDGIEEKWEKPHQVLTEYSLRICRNKGHLVKMIEHIYPRTLMGDGRKYTHKQAEKIIKEFQSEGALEAVRIKTCIQDSPLSACASKFGGLPYWVQDQDYPKSEKGMPLFLLAQINFAQVPHLPDYPESGLLQIFVDTDYMYGCGTGSSQKNWRIVWREEVSEDLAMDSNALHELGVRAASEIDSDTEFLPFEKEYALSFEKTMSFSDSSNDGFDDRIKQIANRLLLPVFGGYGCEWFESEDYSKLTKSSNSVKHQIGGYPFFAQGSAKPNGTLLLLQIDSELGNCTDGKGKDWEILWGDSGVANFFITQADLKARNFSNVLYNWDCF